MFVINAFYIVHAYRAHAHITPQGDVYFYFSLFFYHIVFNFVEKKNSFLVSTYIYHANRRAIRSREGGVCEAKGNLAARV